MSDHHPSASQSSSKPSHPSPRQTYTTMDVPPLELIDQCLASLPEGDERIALLYQLRHRLIELTTATQQHVAERTKMQAVNKYPRSLATGVFMCAWHDAQAAVSDGSREQNGPP